MSERTPPRRRSIELTLLLVLAIAGTAVMALVAIWMYWMAPALLR